MTTPPPPAPQSWRSAGGQDFPSTLNGKPVEHHPGRSIRDVIVGVGSSLRVTPGQFPPSFGAHLRAGGMFSREGSGALTLCYQGVPHQLVGLPGRAGRHPGRRIADQRYILAGDGLRRGNYVIAGSEPVYAELTALFEKAGGAVRPT